MGKIDNIISRVTGGGESSNGQKISDVQSFGKIDKSVSDKTYGTYEVNELKKLPKSLFYDGATALGAYQGLFAYYVLGDTPGNKVPYSNSESIEHVNKITPEYSRNPTAKAVIDTVTKKTKNGIPAYLDPDSVFRGQIYNVKDFIFCKNYGIIPNNRMLTLRRFPSPTQDSLRIISSSPSEFSIGKDNKISLKSVSLSEYGKIADPNAEYNSTLPVAQAVTWFGEGTGNNLNTILGISTGLNYQPVSQNPLLDQQTGDPGLMNSPFGDLIKSYLATGKSDSSSLVEIDKLIGSIASPEKAKARLERLYLDRATSADGPLSKKIFVNLNSVDGMVIRNRGFSGGDESFSIKFEYKLTSVGNINTKLLFLDLITNLLSLGTDYGQFLSPEIRTQQTGIGIGFPGGAEGYAKSITDPMGYINNLITNLVSGDTVNKLADMEKTVKDKLGKVVTELKNFVKDPIKNKIDKNGDLGKSLSVILTDQFLKQIYFQPIMLSGYPIGEWHLVVGNPLNPIAMIGNLVCTKVSIDLNEDLGPDDFPTEVSASFTMKPARQRHRGDWESMFNRGNGRLYLGELFESGESTDAYINQTGSNVNDTKGKQTSGIIYENSSK